MADKRLFVTCLPLSRLGSFSNLVCVPFDLSGQAAIIGQIFEDMGGTPHQAGPTRLIHLLHQGVKWSLRDAEPPVAHPPSDPPRSPVMAL